MRWLVILLSLVATSAFALPAPKWTMGLGVESRAQKEVNPDVTEADSVPLLYAKLRVWPYDFLMELGQEGRDTSSGSLSVSSRTIHTGLWGQYQFMSLQTLSPFVSVGTGVLFDRVTTSFQGSQYSNPGTRMMVGAGIGVSKLFWRKMLVELEGRLEETQQSQDAGLSGLVRIGYQL